ncbi:S26 family signal peptidase [Paraliobacillus quinghaiensis]
MIIIVLMTLTNKYLFASVSVSGESMLPTFHNKDRLLVKKLESTSIQ